MNCLSALHCLACTIVCLLQSLFCSLVLYFHPLIFQSERRGFYFSRINQWPVHPYTSVECLFACATGIEPVPPYNIFWSESSVQALLKDNLHSYSILTSENLIDNLYICMSFLSTSLVTRRWDFCSLRLCLPNFLCQLTFTVFYRPTNKIRRHILGICSESFMILSVPSWFHLTCQCALPDPMQDQIIWKGSDFLKQPAIFHLSYAWLEVLTLSALGQLTNWWNRNGVPNQIVGP